MRIFKLTGFGSGIADHRESRINYYRSHLPAYLLIYLLIESSDQVTYLAGNHFDLRFRCGEGKERERREREEGKGKCPPLLLLLLLL